MGIKIEGQDDRNPFFPGKSFLPRVLSISPFIPLFPFLHSSCLCAFVAISTPARKKLGNVRENCKILAITTALLYHNVFGLVPGGFRRRRLEDYEEFKPKN
jgi:hypothetical protein